MLDSNLQKRSPAIWSMTIPCSNQAISPNLHIIVLKHFQHFVSDLMFVSLKMELQITSIFSPILS